MRFNGAAWETGWHFCPRDSLNVIINQPTSLFFEAPSVFFFHYPRLSGTQRQKCKGGGGIAFERSGVGDWVAFLSKGFTQRHHQSTHFSVVFFFEGAIESPPLCTEANSRGEKGCGDRPNTNSLSALGELSLTG